MSGYKHATVTISQEEYRRLHEADMKKRFKEFANLNEQSSAREEQYLNVIQQMEVRQRELESTLSNLSQNANQIDETILADLHAQNTMCFESLAAALQETDANLNHSIASISSEFSEALQQERERFRSNIEALVDNEENRRYTTYAKEEAARQWLDRCLVLADLLQSQYDHERFTPGRLSKSLRLLNFAENNLCEGFLETSLQGSQQVYLDLSDLHFELEQITIQWQSAFETTHVAIKRQIQQLESNASVYAIGLQGEELPGAVDLDYWTEGRYSQLLQHCRQLSGFVVQDQNCLTFDDINRIDEQILPAIRESFESIIYDARLNALNSQLRMNIAEQALQALELHGYKLEEAGYSGNDMRAQFDAYLDCPDGSRVDIHVVPAETAGAELCNDLVVITTHPFLKTEHEARLRWEELTQALNQFNLRVSRTDTRSVPDGSPSALPEFTRPVEKKFTRSERM